MESLAPSGYTVGTVAHFPAPTQSEVRLPQGLRFTDVRRSTIGDFPVARCGPRASKSHGCNQLFLPSCMLYPLRLPSVAACFCANLRCLLDRNPCPQRFCVCVLRGYTRRASGFIVRCALPGLPPCASASCAGSCLRPLSGPYESGHSCPQVRPDSPSGQPVGPHAS